MLDSYKSLRENLMKPAWPIILVLTLLTITLTATPHSVVRGQPANISQIYLSPSSNCCQFNKTGIFTLSVMVNLAASEAVNVVDVRLNYSNFWSISTNRTGLIQAQPNGISSSGNIFGSSNDIISECIDAVAVSGQTCSSDDAAAGQVHFSAGGNIVSGPLTAALLFRVVFTVHGNGTAIFTFDRTDLVNPSQDPNNPALLNPHKIKLIRTEAIFSNKGLAAFFNYEPSTSQAILPNEPIIFDASDSLNGTTGAALVQPTYAWSFGDSTGKTVPSSSSSTSHTFATSGSFLVQLNVTEANGAFASITRTVVVVPALGDLSIIVRDSRGSAIIGGILVQISNTSLTKPFLNKTIAPSGQVNFTSLTPTDYFLQFSGPGYQNSSKTETVTAGWTTEDNVYLLSIPTPSQNITGLIVIAGVVVGGMAVGALGLFVRRRRERASKKSTTQRVLTSRKR